MAGTASEPPSGYIIRPWITLKNGRRIYAAHYGKKGFTIPINPDYKPPERVDS